MPEPAPDRSPRAAASERPAVPARQLALGAALGALALVLGAYIAYRQLIHYERRAVEHVPPGAELALRVDLEQVVMFEPVRRHLLPLVDRVPVSGTGREPPPARLGRLREAGLNLGMDLREAVFARLPGGAWTLALGGIFGSAPLIPRIEAVLRAEPGVRPVTEGARLVLEPSGVALAQADDGVLLIASDAASLERARPASRGYEAVGLRREGPAALGALAGWLRALREVEPDAPAPSEPAQKASPQPATAASSSLVRASAWLELGDPLELSVEIEHAAPVEIAAARRELDAWLGTPTSPDQFAPEADWGGERALAARSQLTQSSPTRVTARASWERAELDRAAKSLAAWLEARLHASGPVAR